MTDFRIDMAALHLFFKRAPKETAKATARLLNDEAFTYKELAPKTLAERYIFRNPGFVRAMFRVEKANSSLPPSSQKAIAGSIKRGNFTGWAEAVPGGPEPKRNRTLGLRAREGDYSRKVPSSNRLMAGLTFQKSENFSSIPARLRVPAMLSILARNPDYAAAGKGAFIIRGGNWVPGLYRWTNKKTQAAHWSSSKKKKKQLRDTRDRGTRTYPAVRLVQVLDKAPKSRPFNWPALTIQKLQAWFNP